MGVKKVEEFTAYCSPVNTAKACIKSYSFFSRIYKAKTKLENAKANGNSEDSKKLLEELTILEGAINLDKIDLQTSKQLLNIAKKDLNEAIEKLGYDRLEFIEPGETSQNVYDITSQFNYILK
ncbi:hypothetical protein L21SP3_01768 [Sedimentisphaera cyanobacteriorum]|uniref:Uncharacterized protein n=1 Tax=Sedimentisphaera cyanobacteriorum TaxID=1940790 RepID=A0A1Q2HR67_9BACT|nr:hypothetical protein [Sedimentisphaera cyanobacteriorum]AQQ09947.1 hypothetical protein L21SP3_01768 [Sedimentisphaera cyanobacteriorum]